MSGKNVLLIGLILVSLNSCSVRKSHDQIHRNPLVTTEALYIHPMMIHAYSEALPFTKSSTNHSSKDSLNPNSSLPQANSSVSSTGFCIFPRDTLHDSLQAEKKAAEKEPKNFFSG
jgi:hypothetical protein